MKYPLSTHARTTPLGGLAALSALLFLGALAWSVGHPEVVHFAAPATVSKPASSAESIALNIPSISTTTTATSSTALGDAVLGAFARKYQTLTQSGSSADAAAQEAADIVPNISYKTFSSSDIIAGPDTSLKAVLKYRADMRTALAPLLNNTTPEFEIYAQYIDTGDTHYLDTLSSVATDYRLAIEQTRHLTVPADATSYHVAILNAMSEFAAMLDGLVNNAHDSVASVALLRTYNKAEADMFTSFNALGRYAAQKSL